MLAGFVLLGQSAGTYRLSDIVAAPPSGGVVSVALVLILIGAFTKSAQYPFHSWLPAAMVAPTPISAYLHSAAMVKVGVYLIARLSPAFADAGIWRPLVVTVGLTTMIAGGLRALRPFDLKQVLAFGTVSQLGFMVVLVGIGRPEATAAGCAVLIAHGLFKAALFMVVGIVDHQGGTRDVRLLDLGAGWTPTKVVAVVSAASMAAVPPLAGFIAKETAYDALLHGSPSDRWVLAGIVTGSVLTVAYSARLVAGLVRPSSISDTVEAPSAPAPAPALIFLAPAILLAGLTLVAGAIPRVWNRLIDAAARVLDPASGARPPALARCDLGARAVVAHVDCRRAPVRGSPTGVLVPGAVGSAHVRRRWVRSRGPRAQPRRTRDDGRRPARITAGVCGSDPVDGRRGADDRARPRRRGGRAGRSSSAPPPTCRSPAC